MDQKIRKKSESLTKFRKNGKICEISENIHNNSENFAFINFYR